MYLRPGTSHSVGVGVREGATHMLVALSIRNVACDAHVIDLPRESRHHASHPDDGTDGLSRFVRLVECLIAGLL